MNDKIIQLEIWSLLEEASQVPMEVEWHQLWHSLDLALEDLDLNEQLVVAAQALSSLVEIFKARSADTFEEIDAVVSDDGPVMGDAHFAPFIRQSMSIDFDQFVEAPQNSYRKPYEYSDNPLGFLENNSIAEFVDKQVLLEAVQEIEETTIEQQRESVLNIAHSENVGAWVDTITKYITDKSTTLVSMIMQDLDLVPVEVWLGLLLGGFCLRSNCLNADDFSSYEEYSCKFYSSEILVIGESGA
ncbi:hypothetical protein CAL7716_102940 (plasmid) [Calothrix sp. PCC 7716]|nr:hypothetical protein CAL7716_102940 [Calothrix sp. PCC 7716]